MKVSRKEIYYNFAILKQPESVVSYNCIELYCL
jgi:hypothetical protein